VTYPEESATSSHQTSSRNRIHHDNLGTSLKPRSWVTQETEPMTASWWHGKSFLVQ